MFDVRKDSIRELTAAEIDMINGADFTDGPTEHTDDKTTMTTMTVTTLLTVTSPVCTTTTTTTTGTTTSTVCPSTITRPPRVIDDLGFTVANEFTN